MQENLPVFFFFALSYFPSKDAPRQALTEREKKREREEGKKELEMSIIHEKPALQKEGKHEASIEKKKHRRRR